MPSNYYLRFLFRLKTVQLSIQTHSFFNMSNSNNFKNEKGHVFTKLFYLDIQGHKRTMKQKNFQNLILRKITYQHFDGRSIAQKLTICFFNFSSCTKKYLKYIGLYKMHLLVLYIHIPTPNAFVCIIEQICMSNVNSPNK